MNRKTTLFLLFTYLGATAFLVVAPLQATPSLILEGHTVAGATVTVLQKGIPRTTRADKETGFFRKELSGVDLELPNIITIYAEKDSIRSAKKVITIQFPVGIPQLTVSNIIIEIPAQVIPFTSCIRNGDLNNDGVINFQDFASLLFYWGTSRCEADLNQSQRVDFPDFAILLSLWGTEL